MPQQFDTLIIGSGLAGLTLALKIADQQQVCIVSKRTITDSASSWAQGGIATVLNSDDSIDAHVKDTLIAGADLCDTAITRLVTENGHEAIDWLIDLGVEFTREEGSESGLHLTREGGHSARRIVHVADATGHAVQKTLSEKVREHANITLLEDHIAVDLITTKKLKKKSKNSCLGAYVLNNQTGQVLTIAAQKTAIATGGAGKVYLYTTNPDVSTGDGIAMAWRAGCRVSNMEAW